MDFTSMLSGLNGTTFQNVWAAWMKNWFGADPGPVPVGFTAVVVLFIAIEVLFKIIDAVRSSLDGWTMEQRGVHARELMDINGAAVVVEPGVTRQGHLTRTGENLDGEDTFDIEGGRIALGGGMYASSGDKLTISDKGLKTWEFNDD